MGLKSRKEFYMMPQAALEADFLHGRPATAFEAKEYIASKANRKPRKVQIGELTIHLERGEFITSQEKLAAKFNWDRKKVRQFLRREAEADHVAFVTKRGKKGGYTRITIKDIWDLDLNVNGEKQPNDEGEVNRIPRLLPHRPEVRDVSSLSKCNSKYGTSGSPDGSVSGSEDGVLKSARAEGVAIDHEDIGRLEFATSLGVEPSTQEFAALITLSQAEFRQVVAEVEAGQSLAVALSKIKTDSTAVDVVKKVNDG